MLKFYKFKKTAILVLIFTLGVLLGVSGLYAYQQTERVRVLSERINLLETKLTATPFPTLTPITSPTPTVSNEPPPGTVPAIEPQGKQKALIEIENKMANLKAGIQKYMQDYENLKNTPYADTPLNAAKQLQSQYNDLEKERWEILSQ